MAWHKLRAFRFPEGEVQSTGDKLYGGGKKEIEGLRLNISNGL